jgi:hypothetical protein
MGVTTGGITVAVGSIMVVALGVAGVATLRDEPSDRGSKQEPPCVSQPRDKARQAQRELKRRFLDPDASVVDGWYVGDALSTRKAVNDLIRRAVEADLPADERLPTAVGDESVLLVLYDFHMAPPSLPACLNDTPVVLVSTGGRARFD